MEKYQKDYSELERQIIAQFNKSGFVTLSQDSNDYDVFSFLKMPNGKVAVFNAYLVSEKELIEATQDDEFEDYHFYDCIQFAANDFFKTHNACADEDNPAYNFSIAPQRPSRFDRIDEFAQIVCDALGPDRRAIAATFTKEEWCEIFRKALR
jgi:hypothetical protein